MHNLHIYVLHVHNFLKYEIAAKEEKNVISLYTSRKREWGLTHPKKEREKRFGKVGEIVLTKLNLLSYIR